ncbi:MAG: cysteine methyltransferase [Bacteroidetes bacterium]|nr:MAG: cysteine methyltransferase [Bacteroidota bacterium]
MNNSNFLYDSPIGLIAIHATGDHIDSILFANSGRGPVVDKAEIKNVKTTLPIIQNCVTQLEEYFEGKRKDFDFNFLQSGTAFQEKIWNELTHIPYGRTISYLELSKRIGNVKAIRAVGTTNGKNQLCIVVPCHRVIGSSGSLVGYGGELWRKKWLLEHEAKFANGVQVLF